MEIKTDPSWGITPTQQQLDKVKQLQNDLTPIFLSVGDGLVVFQACLSAAAFAATRRDCPLSEKFFLQFASLHYSTMQYLGDGIGVAKPKKTPKKTLATKKRKLK